MSNHKEYYARARKQALQILGNKCVRCGFSDPRALQIDHITGNGYIQRRASNVSSRSICSDIIGGNTKDYQILCANCNWIKRAENGEQPYNRGV